MIGKIPVIALVVMLALAFSQAAPPAYFETPAAIVGTIDTGYGTIRVDFVPNQHFPNTSATVVVGGKVVGKIIGIYPEGNRMAGFFKPALDFRPRRGMTVVLRVEQEPSPLAAPFTLNVTSLTGYVVELDGGASIGVKPGDYFELDSGHFPLARAFAMKVEREKTTAYISELLTGVPLTRFLSGMTAVRISSVWQGTLPPPGNGGATIVGLSTQHGAFTLCGTVTWLNSAGDYFNPTGIAVYLGHVNSTIPYSAVAATNGSGFYCFEGVPYTYSLHPGDESYILSAGYTDTRFDDMGNPYTESVLWRIPVDGGPSGKFTVDLTPGNAQATPNPNLP